MTQRKTNKDKFSGICLLKVSIPNSHKGVNIEND